MARFAVTPANNNVDALRRQFGRQNWSLARSHSALEARIGSLEASQQQLMAENYQLRCEIARVHALFRKNVSKLRDLAGAQYRASLAELDAHATLATPQKKPPVKMSIGGPEHTGELDGPSLGISKRRRRYEPIIEHSTVKSPRQDDAVPSVSKFDSSSISNVQFSPEKTPSQSNRDGEKPNLSNTEVSEVSVARVSPSNDVTPADITSPAELSAASTPDQGTRTEESLPSTATMARFSASPVSNRSSISFERSFGRGANSIFDDSDDENEPNSIEAIASSQQEISVVTDLSEPQSIRIHVDSDQAEEQSQEQSEAQSQDSQSQEQSNQSQSFEHSYQSQEQNQTPPRRRSRGVSVNYALPSLRTKMRRTDQENMVHKSKSVRKSSKVRNRGLVEIND